MGLLRIAAVGALGYFAYRALQQRPGQALARHDGLEDTDTRHAADDDALDAHADSAVDDTRTTGTPHPATGAYRPS